MSSATVRFTEQSNPLTLTLDADAESPLAALNKLRLVDAELCAGLQRPETAAALNRLCATVHAWLDDNAQRRRVHVLVSGAGTSGRVAHLAARRANQLVANGAAVQWHYCCAGGDKALIEAQEHSEDDVELARRDLRRFLLPLRDNASAMVVYIGVTCGMSAPYVAAQLDECLSAGASFANRLVPVLMGFNPVAAARSAPIEGWNRSFRDVAEAHVAAGHTVINPAVGAEAVAGSTRMKGGSATKLLLDVLATRFVRRERSTEQLIGDIAAAVPLVYERLDALLPPVMASAARSLRAHAHVYYVGVDVLGLWSIVDASECPPTFGAVFGDIQGFVDGGWRAVRNVDGDLSLLPETAGKSQYRISSDNFRSDIKLSAADTVVFLCHSAAFPEFRPFDVAPATSFTLAAEHFAPEHVGLVRDGGGDFALLELACKLALNATSTFAWVANGKVFGNRMIDLAISNNKLYFRAQTIVRDVLGEAARQLHDDDIERAVLRAVYSVDESGQIVNRSGGDVETLRGAPVSEHVHAAFGAKQRGVKVVPIAVLLASGLAQTATDAHDMLERTILRTLVERARQR
jgi:N-acetylmuramic acid 6-phosphate (MurNAc-6-P) etherase